MVTLTRDIVVQFAEEQSWTGRARLAEQVATLFAGDELGPEERPVALDLIRLAIYDAEPLVRRVLAESIKHARMLPPDVVETLVRDVPEVSAPFLAASPLLGEDDLLPLVKTGGTVRLAAIACRPSLSVRLIDAISDAA